MFIRIYSDIRSYHFLDTNIFGYSFVSKSIRMSHSDPKVCLRESFCLLVMRFSANTQFLPGVKAVFSKTEKFIRFGRQGLPYWTNSIGVVQNDRQVLEVNCRCPVCRIGKRGTLNIKQLIVASDKCWRSINSVLCADLQVHCVMCESQYEFTCFPFLYFSTKF